MAAIADVFKVDMINAVKAQKVNSEAGDGHKDGARCVIIAETADTPYGIIYLTIFDDYPLPVAVADYRVKLLANEKKVKMKLSKQQKKYLGVFPKNLFKYYTDAASKEGSVHDQNTEEN